MGWMFGLSIMALCYVLGGLHGLYLGQTQFTRMQGWARRVCEVQEAVKDAYHRGGVA